MARAIEVEGLSKRYQLGETVAVYDTLRDSIARSATRLMRSGGGSTHRRDEVWALQDVSFNVEQGEMIGLIGRNGAGKTTLMRVLSRITYPTQGRARLRGRLGSLLEVGTGFHPELSGRDNIYLNGAILGMRRFEISRRFDEIVEFAGVSKFIDTPVKRYSSGMYLRLAFSVAAHLEPEILLVDEVLAVGDAEFQKRCLGKMESIGQSGRTIVFVSHSMPTIMRICERVILLDAGKVVDDGPTARVVAEYLGSENGTPALRTWEAGNAPGDGVVRLNAVRVLDRSGSIADTVDMRDEVAVEVELEVLTPEVPGVPMLAVYNEQGTHVFNAIDPDPAWEGKRDRGVYRSRALIPGHLLNEGRYIVSVLINTLAPGRTVCRAVAQEAVSFHVINRGETLSAKGPYLQPWGGAVSPMLEWTTSRGGGSDDER
ncbi:MAG TPA: polysaccharide ABC transporter ATP-binding protein [Gaiellaceae bacterium]